MPSILESVAGVLDIGEGWGKLGAAVGGEEQARSALDAVGPVLIGGLADRIGQGGEGREAVLALLDAADATIVDQGADGVLDGGDEYGSAVLTGLFGEDRAELGDGLAERAEIDADGFAALLPKLAPVVTGVVEHLRQADELDDDAVAGLLTAEREALADDDDLGDWFTGLVATGAAGAVLAGAADDVEDLIDALTGADDGDVTGADDAEAGDVAGADDGDGGDVAGADDGDGGDVTGADDAAAEGAGAVAGDAAADEEEAAAAVDPEDGATEGDEVTVEAEADAGDGDAADADGKPLAAAAAAGAVTKGAAKAKAKNKAGSGAATTKAKAKAEAGTTTQAAKAKAKAGAGTATQATKAKAKVTAGAGAGATTEAASGGDGSGRRGLGWLWWGAGAVILFVVLALVLSGLSSDGDDSATDDDEVAEAASTDDVEVDEGDGTAEGTADEGDGAEVVTVDDDELSTLVDAVLPQGVTATVESGVVTLSGVAATEDEVDAAVEAVGAIDGVESVLSEIEVSGAADDAAVEAELTSRLADLALPEGMTVTVQGTEVVLGGTAASYAEVEAVVAAIAETMLGIDDYAITSEVAIGDDAGSGGAATTPPAGPGATLNDQLQLAPVTFRYLSGTVTDSGAEVLDEVVAYLQANDLSVQIQGHTDSDGSEGDNQVLSERRAGAVRDYLVEHGIPAERLSTVGFGESQPKVPNDSLEGKAENRRIEFVIVS